MTWSTLPAYSDGNAFTAAQVTAIKDNINESAAAKATTAGYWYVSTGTNALAERAIVQATVATGQTTTSTSYTTLTTAGPAVTLTTGTQAMINVVSQVNNTTDGASARHSFAVSGATTTASDDTWSALIQATSSRDCSQSRTTLMTLTGGSNTFTSQYRVSSGTGRWQDRNILGMGM